MKMKRAFILAWTDKPSCRYCRVVHSDTWNERRFQVRENSKKSCRQLFCSYHAFVYLCRYCCSI